MFYVFILYGTIGMSWNQTIQATMDESVNNALADINVNFPVIMDRTPAAVLNLNGAASQISTAKNKIEGGIETIKRNTNVIIQTMETIANNAQDVTANLRERREETERLKNKVAEAKKLYDLRREQAVVLDNKQAGNYHSSWLGLWRPLTDDSRVGLLVSAIVFGIIALILFVFIGYSLVPSSILPAKQFIGGFTLKRNK